VGAEQGHGDRAAQERPIHEVVRVVPSVDGVVEIEGVAIVDQEREYEQRVDRERIGGRRPRAAKSAGTRKRRHSGSAHTDPTFSV